MKKKSKRNIIFVLLLMIMVGIIMLVLPYVLPELITQEMVRDILLYGGIGLAVIFALILMLFMVATSPSKKSKSANTHEATVQQPAPSKPAPKKNAKAAKKAKEPEVIEAKEPLVAYVPGDDAFKFVEMGNRQSMEEKFQEIAKMGQTQFVIYIAKLFSRKGYEVKFTPVIDNYDIDLLVQKMGVVLAVGCIHSTKILSEKEVDYVLEGSKHYQADRVMVVTNMYFDRSAVDYAKREKMSLVDRQILKEDYMK